MWRRLPLLLLTIALGVLTACDDRSGTPLGPGAVTARSRAAEVTILEVKFREDLQVRSDARGRLRSERGASLAALAALLDRHGISEARPLVSASADRLDALVREARARSGGDVPDMASWHHLILPNGMAAQTVLAQLRERPEVVHAYIAPEPVEPPRTPDFSAGQSNYFGPAPSGTEVLYARSLPGGRGAGIKLVDLEYDWTFEHEDLGLSPAILIAGQRNSLHGQDHGTAALGILVGRDNGFGITGGATDATIRVAAPHNTSGVFKPADAIISAALDMVAGDVLLIELQARGPYDYYAPIEWYDGVYDAIRLVTQSGRIVVEPAGNGSISLDAWFYGGRFDRSRYNSGAIMVGAGDGANARLPFSNYGSRLDVQAHGGSVTTTGYGYLYGGSPLNEYTDRFSGTSSASAIVAAVATVLQGYQKHRGRPPLAPSTLTYLLTSTGSPQTGNTAQRIGPKPNVRAVIAQIETPPPPPDPLEGYISGPWEVPAGATCSWSAMVTGGNPPYSYIWYWDGEIVGTYSWYDRVIDDDAPQYGDVGHLELIIIDEDGTEYYPDGISVMRNDYASCR